MPPSWWGIRASTMGSRSRVLSLIAGVAAIGGCGLITGGGDCTTEARPAIVLEIVDIVTGASPLVPSVITVTDGSFEQRSPPPGTAGAVLPRYQLALGRPGRYSILVETPGYLNWSTSNINVPEGDCGHPETARITARLKR